MSFTPHPLFREERVAPAPETAPGFGRQYSRLSNYVRKWSLYGWGAVSNYAYLQRRGCHFTRNDQLKYFKMSVERDWIFVLSYSQEFSAVKAAQSLCGFGLKSEKQLSNFNLTFNNLSNPCHHSLGVNSGQLWNMITVGSASVEHALIYTGELERGSSKNAF